MCIKHISAVYELDINKSLKSILLAIADHAKKDGTCFPGLKHLAKKTGYTRISVIRAIDALVKMNILQKHHRFRPNGSQASNAYKIINLPLKSSKKHPKNGGINDVYPGINEVKNDTPGDTRNDTQLVSEMIPLESSIEPSINHKINTISRSEKSDFLVDEETQDLDDMHTISNCSKNEHIASSGKMIECSKTDHNPDATKMVECTKVEQKVILENDDGERAEIDIKGGEHLRKGEIIKIDNKIYMVIKPKLPRKSPPKTKLTPLEPAKNEEAFMVLWNIYPRSEGKSDAFKAFLAIDLTPELFKEIIEGAKFVKTQVQLGKELKFVKMLGGWLRSRRWEDKRVLEKGSLDERIFEPRRYSLAERIHNRQVLEDIQAGREPRKLEYLRVNGDHW